VSDPSWKAAAGPLLKNSVYLGEVYDARNELPGWDKPRYDDAAWVGAVEATEPLGVLRSQDAPPIRITRRLQPVKITEPKPGVYLFDLGQNFAGWVRLRVKGEAGTRVRLRYGELLYPDGSLNGMTSVCGQIKQGGKDYEYNGQGYPKTAFQQDEYILKGGGNQEVYTPQFTFHGFRYVEVSGYPGKPSLDALEGLRLNSDVATAGSFACSNERLNRIQHMVLWTELSNLFSVQSDCPHREKFGYGGDLVASSEMAMFNFDMARFYAKAVQDLTDAARPNGGFTETAPFVGIADESLGEKSGPVGWGTAQPLLAWQLYQHYGDKRLLERSYEATRRWIELLKSRAKDGILDNGISDHESLVPKPRALTGTAFYYHNVRLFSFIAAALGQDAAAAEAAALAESIKSAFNARFLQPGTGRYAAATQAAQAFALYMGLVPAHEAQSALHVLVQAVQEKRGHLDTGIFGTKYMLNALTALGRADVAYEIVNQRTFPGWGWMLENGATTLWEHWEFSDNTYSHNHPMFGSVSEWFYKALAGINLASDAAGFDRIIFGPQPVGDLTWVKASHDSIRGKITSEWTRHGNGFKLKVRVPVGASATVILRAKESARILEDGKPLDRSPGVELLRRDPETASVGIESGSYEFSVEP
jgi:alpha-L-rhamnosidase